ncbi:MAG: hypothetical protein ABIG46_03790 [Candidatus Omnitrophota bacterium]
MREKIVVNGEFVAIDTKPLDSKNRITLGERLMKFVRKKMRVDSYRMFIDTAGDILLRPEVAIPSREAWIYENPKVIGNIRKGIQDIKEGKSKHVTDVDKYLDHL